MLGLGMYVPGSHSYNEIDPNLRSANVQFAEAWLGFTVSGTTG
jgi:hypothetical protein